MASNTPSDFSLRALSLSELAEHCMSEIDTYLQGGSCDARSCLELLQRAMEQRDAAARGALEQCFHPLMLGWLRSHPQRTLAYALDSEEHYVAQAFAHFWQAIARSKELVCRDLVTALDFLCASVHNALLDALRSSARSRKVLLPVPVDPAAPYATGHNEAQALWEYIRLLIPDEREQRAAYLFFHCGLKPREIIRRYPEAFNDVQELYRLYSTVIERLQGQAPFLFK